MTEPVAELRGATRRYDRVVALDRVDLALAAGQVTALLGPNGAGKTTAVRLVLGLTRPSEGSARLFGRDPRDLAVRQRVGIMLQVSKVPETLKVSEHLRLFSSYYPSPLPAAEVVALTGLTGVEDRQFGKLSGGQKQRLLFALALCGNPDLLVLDEPTIGLDVESRRAFWQEVRNLVTRGRSLLLTTHYIEEADALADRIVVLQGGRIIADGTPAEIKTGGAGRQIRCVTRLTDDELAAMPGVRVVRHDKNRTLLVVTAAERVVQELLTRDPSLSNLDVADATLEDAFLALTAAAPAAPASAMPSSEARTTCPERGSR
jgi:ABC-2 type transport system ATP-binding protein